MRTISGVLVGVWLAISPTSLAGEEGPASGDASDQTPQAPESTGTEPLAEPDSLVGNLGNPSRWNVLGPVTFPPQEIVKALADDIEVAYVARCDSPRDVFLERLVWKVTQGYRSGGFFLVKAKAAIDAAANNVVISIDEGQRFMAGELRVTGAKAIDAGWLVDELTPAPKPAQVAEGRDAKAAANVGKKGVCWPIGKPVPSDVELDRLHRRIEELLADRGLAEASFTFKMILEDGVATLEVDFSDEGVPATIGKIELRGNERNSREDLLAFLEVKPDMLLTRDLCERMQDRLTNSGRFVKSSVKTVQPKYAGNPLKLQIWVTEYDQAPHLGQPLSREEAALVRFSHWVRHFDEGDDDLLVEFTDGTRGVETVISPRQGILGVVHGPLPGDAPEVAPVPFQWAGVVTEDLVGLYSMRRHRKISAAPPPSPLIVRLELAIHAATPPFDGQGAFRFGLGLDAEAKNGSRRHVQVKLKQTAVAALALAHLPGAQCSWNGDILTVRYNDRLLRIEDGSGRMLELSVTKEAGAPWSDVRLTTARGEFDRRLTAIEAAAADLPNEADEARPLSCVCNFACEEALALPLEAALPDARRAFVTFNKLVDLGLFEPIDGLLAEVCVPNQDRDKFSIPKDDDNTGDLDDFARLVADRAKLRRAACINWGMPVGDYLLPRDTWAWRLWRETMFCHAEVGQAESAESTNAASTCDTGALGCLLSSLISQPSANGDTSSFANAGLERVSLEEFRRDYLALLRFIPLRSAGRSRQRRDLGTRKSRSTLGRASPGAPRRPAPNLWQKMAIAIAGWVCCANYMRLLRHRSHHAPP
jgi:hypothetical protein